MNYSLIRTVIISLSSRSIQFNQTSFQLTLIEWMKIEWMNGREREGARVIRLQSINAHSFTLQRAWWIEAINWSCCALFIRVTFRQLIHSFHWMNVNWLKLIAHCGRSINPAQFNHCVNVIEWRIEFTSYRLHFHSTSLQFTLTQWIEWLSWVGEWMTPFPSFIACIQFHFISLQRVKWVN